MNPEILLEELKNNADIRRARNMEIIHDICREQHTRGSKDFTIATIGRLSEDKGGPKVQSIRNKNGEDFRALISGWSNHVGGSTKRLPKPNENPLFAALEQIPDPALRAVFGNVLAENRKLRRQLDLVKRNTKIVIDRRPLAPTGPREAIQILPPFNDLTESEKSALRDAISEKKMQDEGWQIDEQGRIRNDKGRTLFKPRFATAIQKVLATLPPVVNGGV